MSANAHTLERPDYRRNIWEYLSKLEFACLKDVARTQAVAGESGAVKQKCQLCVGQKCPQPINLLTNATCFTDAPHGLAGELPPGYKLAGALSCLNNLPTGTPVFNGCNFGVLQQLAEAKQGAPLANPASHELRGFGLKRPLGLAILLGPWADYCLWCWSQHPQLGDGVSPILMLGKDNSCFADESVTSGTDWGAEQVHDTAQIRKASDKSSRVLFGAVATTAERLPTPMRIEEFIAARRILVCNVWPWFRCGLSASGNTGIHSDFAKVPLVRDFAQGLVSCLSPSQIACLGSWTDPNSTRRPEQWVRSELLGLSASSSAPQIKVFPHPSASTWKSKEADFQKSIQ